MTTFIYVLAIIGGYALLAFCILVVWVILQLTTNDNMQPRKPWWWRF